MSGQSFKKRVRERQAREGIPYAEARRRETKERSLRIGSMWAVWPAAEKQLNHARWLEAEDAVKRLEKVGSDAITNPDEMIKLSKLAWIAGDYDGTVDWYLRAAEAGSTKAMRELGTMALLGGDVDQMLYWLTQAIESEEPTILLRIKDVKNCTEAVDWSKPQLQKAADKGDAVAAVVLGDYALAAQDFDMADMWYQCALAAGIVGMFTVRFATALKANGKTAQADFWYDNFEKVMKEKGKFDPQQVAQWAHYGNDPEQATKWIQMR